MLIGSKLLRKPYSLVLLVLRGGQGRIQEASRSICIDLPLTLSKKRRRYTCSEGHVSYSTFQDSGSLPAWVTWHCWEVRGIFLQFPYDLNENTVYSTWTHYLVQESLREIWLFSDLSCGVPSAIASKWQAQKAPASLQTQMDIWIIMDSQLEPLVKLLACYYPKYHCTICIYWKEISKRLYFQCPLTYI